MDEPLERLVAWWRQGDGGSVSELLVVGPGPSPLLDEAHVRCVATTLTGPGEWAVVCRTALGGLPEALAGRVRSAGGAAGSGSGTLRRLVLGLDGTVAADDSLDADDLYESCRRAAIASAARRLADPVVADRPASAGVLVARLSAAGVQLAPATLHGDHAVTALPLPAAVLFGRRGAEGATRWLEPAPLEAADVAAESVSVALPGAGERATELPGVTLAWDDVELGDGELRARFETRLEELHIGPLAAPRLELTLTAAGRG